MKNKVKTLFGNGKKVPTVSKSFRMPKDLYNTIEKLAKSEDRSANNYVVLALDLHIKSLKAAGYLPADDNDSKNKPELKILIPELKTTKEG